MRPFIDRAVPEAWQVAQQLSAAIKTQYSSKTITEQESELIKLRVSQINACAFCLDLHGREARAAGIPQQKIDILPAWRESELFTEREKAVLGVAESSTVLPLTEESRADLSGALHVLGEQGFAVAEWVAVVINTFNRISILSGHPVRPRDTDGTVLR